MISLTLFDTVSLYRAAFDVARVGGGEPFHLEVEDLRAGELGAREVLARAAGGYEGCEASSAGFLG